MTPLNTSGPEGSFSLLRNENGAPSGVYLIPGVKEAPAFPKQTRKILLVLMKDMDNSS